MKIVIIGDGKVGYKLAKQLSSEKYDIILIDNNEEKLRKSIERMDVFCVVGEGGSEWLSAPLTNLSYFHIFSFILAVISPYFSRFLSTHVNHCQHTSTNASL